MKYTHRVELSKDGGQYFEATHECLNEEGAKETAERVVSSPHYTNARVVENGSREVVSEHAKKRIKIKVRQGSFTLKQPALEHNQDASFQYNESSGGGQSKEVWEIDNDPRLLQAITEMGVNYEIV